MKSGYNPEHDMNPEPGLNTEYVHPIFICETIEKVNFLGENTPRHPCRFIHLSAPFRTKVKTFFCLFVLLTVIFFVLIIYFVAKFCRLK